MKFGLFIVLLLLFTVSPVTAVQRSVLSYESILFTSDRTGSWNIFRKILTTGEVVNLTNNAHNNMNPQLSPDKRSVVFYSDRDGINQIYRMDLASKSVTRLTHTQSHEYDPQYSPNGKFIVFKSNLDDGYGDIWLMNADSSGRKNLTKSLRSTEEWIPTFSKDGTKIYFVSGLLQYSEILIMDSRMGDAAPFYALTHNTVPDWYPSVNPVNGEILVISRAPGSSSDSLYTISKNGQKRTKISSLPDDSDDPSWSADGKKIAFINSRTGKYDIYTMNANGSNIQLIEDSSNNELSPIFL
ncbi:MAG: hypothetical protein M3Q44_06660 [bacterium]|nr:hypothetical protein [bacterium]